VNNAPATAMNAPFKTFFRSKAFNENFCDFSIDIYENIKLLFCEIVERFDYPSDVCIKSFKRLFDSCYRLVRLSIHYNLFLPESQ
jgi:hypothetical protein